MPINRHRAHLLLIQSTNLRVQGINQESISVIVPEVYFLLEVVLIKSSLCCAKEESCSTIWYQSKAS